MNRTLLLAIAVAAAIVVATPVVYFSSTLPSSAGQKDGGLARGDRGHAADNEQGDLGFKRAAGPLTYGGLLDAIAAGHPKGKPVIAYAEIDPAKSTVEVEFRDGSREEVPYPPAVTDLAERLHGAGAVVDVVEVKDGTSSRWGFVLRMLPLLGMALIFGFMFTMNRSVNGQKKTMGMRDAKVDDDGPPKVTFRDVAGCDEAVQEIREFVEFLSDPAKFHSVGAAIPRGALLVGPPGTGKTLLAKATAGECGASFFSASGSEFVEKFVGVGAARVRELFTRARAAAPSIVFIDEIDAVGRKRSSGADTATHSEQEQTLNELLVQMDGLGNDDDQIIVFAATNRPELLDPALKRPGRLTREVLVDLPREDGRLAILRLHSRGKPFDDSVDFERLAKITDGSSGAELANMVNEAAIMAARENRTMISQADLEEGFMRALMGPEKRSNTMTAEEKRTVAYHEAGHVLVAELCATLDKAQRTTIKPRGKAMGVAVYGRTDRALHSTQFIHERLMAILGGRAAEEVVNGMITSGAANDLQQANQIARQAVEELGMSPQAGQMITSSSGQHIRVSDEHLAVVDGEVRRIVADAYAHALQVLTEHRAALDTLAGALLEREDLNRQEIEEALTGVRPVPRTAPSLGPAAPPVPRSVPVAAATIERSRAAQAAEKLGELADILRPRRRRRPGRRPMSAATFRGADSSTGA